MSDVKGSAIAAVMIALSSCATLQAGLPSGSWPLRNGVALYEDGKYRDAVTELSSVVEGKTNDDKGGRDTALFFLGKTYFNLKKYADALHCFGGVVSAGHNDANYIATLKWLGMLARFFPTAVELASHYAAEDFDTLPNNDLRAELLYLVGRYHFVNGDPAGATALFVKIPTQSRFAAQSKALLAEQN